MSTNKVDQTMDADFAGIPPETKPSRSASLRLKFDKAEAERMEKMSKK